MAFLRPVKIQRIVLHFLHSKGFFPVILTSVKMQKLKHILQRNRKLGTYFMTNLAVALCATMQRRISSIMSLLYVALTSCNFFVYYLLSFIYMVDI